MSELTAPSILRCVGCGYVAAPDDVFPFACANAASGDGKEHILSRRLPPQWIRTALDEGERESSDPNPFIRFRRGLHVWHAAKACGVTDGEYVDRVSQLNHKVAEVDGAGFCETPFVAQDRLADRLGLHPGSLWVKDETRHVSGSHKARHLFNVLLWVQLQKNRGLLPTVPRLAIASCGNAALAAAVMARAADLPLDVFIPVNAEASVVTRLKQLGATIHVCPRRPNEVGDPCYLRFREATAAGALPFCCQGPDNALAVEGGLGIGWEMVVQAKRARVQLDRIYVQVGGGALGSAVAQAFMEAVESDYLSTMPKIIAVQTAGCAPLKRAYDRLMDAAHQYGWDTPETLRQATVERNRWMWPWEEEPHSLAHGILDDETYDWYGLVNGLIHSGGFPVVASEPSVVQAAELGPKYTELDVCATGTSGLAGLLCVGATETLSGNSALLFTGHKR